MADSKAGNDLTPVAAPGMVKIVLYAPRIPQNTGQIARACWATHSELHLVRPLGFRVDAAALRRASVGYLDRMNFIVHRDGDALWRAIESDALTSLANPPRAWLISKFGSTSYAKVDYRRGDWLIFGNEDEGLPADWLERHRERALRIPMPNPEARCLNLATSACVVLYEALRQLGVEDSVSRIA